MTRTQRLVAGAAVLAALAVTGFAAAKSDTLILAIDPAAREARALDQQDRQLAIAAYTQVLSRQAGWLGMNPPGNHPAYAPVFPDAFVMDASLDPDRDSAGAMQYAAASDVGTALHFYEDAAARAGLPFKTVQVTPDGATFVAGDGKRRLTAKLTKQFKTSTLVDVSYS